MVKLKIHDVSVRRYNLEVPTRLKDISKKVGTNLTESNIIFKHNKFNEFMFYPKEGNNPNEMHLTSEELRAIADELDKVNRVKKKK